MLATSKLLCNYNSIFCKASVGTGCKTVIFCRVVVSYSFIVFDSKKTFISLMSVDIKQQRDSEHPVRCG